MIKKIGVLSLVSTLSFSQDTGTFENYSNPFYEKIIDQSNNYDVKEKEVNKVFKMSFDGKKIPQSLDEFTIIDVTDPISQGNTGTCWCFSTISFYESEIKRITGKNINLSELYPVYFEYIEKARGFIQSRGKHI